MNSNFVENPPVWHGTNQLVSELADMTGGTIREQGIHPGGDSGYAVLSLELPKDHWLYEQDENGFAPPGELPMLVGGKTMVREYMDQIIRKAARYGIKAATMDGREDDFDPDAMVRNIQNGCFGYFTPDGTMTPYSHDEERDGPYIGTEPARLPKVLMEALRLCVADGLISYNDVVGGVQPEAVARSVSEFKERERVEREAAKARALERGFGYDETVGTGEEDVPGPA